MEVEVIKVSSKGQVVIPASIRKMMHIKPSDKFLVYGKGDTILFKKIEKTALERTFMEIAEPIHEEIRKAGLKEEDLEEIIRRIRAKK
ncbi:AbrB/MazE/SpoVT family DNA-binding domain-containing protein [Candidatus Pyrohabitans sp.]